MIKSKIDNWGFACTLQTHETYVNDDDDDDGGGGGGGKIKGKDHTRTGHEGPEGE